MYSSRFSQEYPKYVCVYVCVARVHVSMCIHVCAAEGGTVTSMTLKSVCGELFLFFDVCVTLRFRPVSSKLIFFLNPYNDWFKDRRGIIKNKQFSKRCSCIEELSLLLGLTQWNVTWF